MAIIDGTAGPVEVSGQTDGMSGGSDLYGALINLGGMLWNNYQQRQMMEQQNAYNRQNAEDKYNRDVAFWNMQNEYNSPSAMMERFKNAGLSPNLIYGGAAAGGNAGRVEAPLVQTHAMPRMMLNNIPESILAFQDIQLKHAQIDNVKAQTDAVKNATLLTAVKTGIADVKKQYDTYAKDLFLEYGHAYASQKLEATANQIGLSEQELAKNRESMSRWPAERERISLENEKARADLLFKQNENQWRSMGITSSDNVLLRVLVRAMQYLK